MVQEVEGEKDQEGLARGRSWSGAVMLERELSAVGPIMAGQLAAWDGIRARLAFLRL